MNLKKTHLFIIGKLSGLNIKKDSSLLMALALKDLGAEVYIVEENNFYITPGQDKIELIIHPFRGVKKLNQFYLEEFSLEKGQKKELDKNWLIHMRSDPPIDQRYMRLLWQLDYLVSRGLKVTNNPRGIMVSNEKLIPYGFPVSGIKSYYGEDSQGLEEFLKSLKCEEIIVKPMDAFSGMGVEKISLVENTLLQVRAFIKKRQEAVIVQPFIKAVYQGEERAIFLGGEFLGAITKYPSEGSFLANIAQGARFEKTTLEEQAYKDCQLLAKNLLSLGIDFIAFDILENKVTEVNVTCPGLVNEVSTALGVDLAQRYAQYFI